MKLQREDEKINEDDFLKPKKLQSYHVTFVVILVCICKCKEHVLFSAECSIYMFAVISIVLLVRRHPAIITFY